MAELTLKSHGPPPVLILKEGYPLSSKQVQGFRAFLPAPVGPTMTILGEGSSTAREQPIKAVRLRAGKSIMTNC